MPRQSKKRSPIVLPPGAGRAYPMGPVLEGIAEWFRARSAADSRTENVRKEGLGNG